MKAYESHPNNDDLTKYQYQRMPYIYLITSTTKHIRSLITEDC